MTNNRVIEQIKERIDIVELIGAKVQLRKAGRSLVGFCPFHPNTRTPGQPEPSQGRRSRVRPTPSSPGSAARQG